MSFKTATTLFLCLIIFSCSQNSNQEDTGYQYFDRPMADTVSAEVLLAVTDEEYIEYTSNIAYLNTEGDTIIPFGKFKYLGTDTLKHFAQVFVDKSKNSSCCVAIDHKERILFDIVFFDNMPEEFNEGLLRVKRNGKMGFANKYGQVVIPCIYDFVDWFENGKARVALNARVVPLHNGEHTMIESDDWFHIDKKGNRID